MQHLQPPLLHFRRAELLFTKYQDISFSTFSFTLLQAVISVWILADMSTRNDEDEAKERLDNLLEFVKEVRLPELRLFVGFAESPSRATCARAHSKALEHAPMI